MSDWQPKELETFKRIGSEHEKMDSIYEAFITHFHMTQRIDKTLNGNGDKESGLCSQFINFKVRLKTAEGNITKIGKYVYGFFVILVGGVFGFFFK